MMLVFLDNKNIKILFYLFILFFLSTINFYKVKEKNISLIFPIKTIEIDGLKIIKKKEIINNLKTVYGKNIFTLNKNEITEILKANNMIKSFLIKKHYPNKILIIVEESEIVGILLKDNKFLLLNDNSKIIKNKKYMKNDSLPIIEGNNAEQYFNEFRNFLILNDFRIELIKRYYFFRSKRWDIVLNNNLILKLPSTKILEAINIANSLLNNSKFISSNVIDLRIKNKIIIN